MTETLHRTDRCGVIAQIRRQAERLVAPSLNGLKALMLERQAVVRSEEDRLALEQEIVSTEGIAAAIRLMMPEDGMLPRKIENKDYFERVLPRLTEDKPNERKK